ncbi:MAG: dihydroorotate dehydrogenase electron transfer subunit [Thermoplasmataceae archaeon]
MIHSTVVRVDQNTPTVRSIGFKWDCKVLPGQFIMVWIPGIGEIPISLSSTGNLKEITVKSYGPASDALTKLETGSRIFFRGPYGRPFTLVKGKTLLIGGGSGMASLKPLINERSYAIVSARTRDELLFSDKIHEGNLHLVTDDGSIGIKGTPLNALEKLNLTEFEMIYVCGPEIMLKKIFDSLRGKKVRAEFAMERTMKCGIGVCDSCSIDGLQLCRDGSIFSMEEVMEMEEFGRTKLSESGRRIILNY